MHSDLNLVDFNHAACNFVKFYLIVILERNVNFLFWIP